MKKIIKKVAIITLAITMLVMMSGYVACPNRSVQGRYFDVGGWTLFQYNRSDEVWSRQVTIVRLNDPSLVEDGVLTIPTQIGGHDIYAFRSFNLQDLELIRLLYLRELL